MSQDDRPEPKWFDANDPTKMRPIDRQAALVQDGMASDLAIALQKLDIQQLRNKLVMTSIGWLLLGAAKNIEHAGASLAGIYDDEDRNKIDANLRGLHRTALETVNKIRELYRAVPLNGELPAKEPEKAQHADR
jgi:hypothetical protein